MPERNDESGSAAPPDRERAALPARRLAVFSAVFVALVCLGAFIAYRELLHYERRALGHVPPAADLVARVDLEQVVLFEPVRRHLLPLIDHGSLGAAGGVAQGTAGQGAAGQGRLARLRQEGVLNLGMDLREIVFARRADGGWLLVLGGMFDGSGLVDGIERVVAREADARWRRDGELLLLGPSGVALAQAADGVLLLGSDPAIVREGIPTAGSAERAVAVAALPAGAASFVALPSSFQAWLGPEGTPALLGSVRRVSGTLLELGEPLELAFQVELGAPAPPDALRSALEAWLGLDAGGAFVPLADWGGERAVLARAHFSQAQPANIEVSSRWPRAELDRAARSLANWLGARLQAAGPAALTVPPAGHDGGPIH